MNASKLMEQGVAAALRRTFGIPDPPEPPKPVKTAEERIAELERRLNHCENNVYGQMMSDR